MLDRLARPLRDLRISVTDRCNQRCPYCMPREIYGADFSYLDRAELLSFEEIASLAEVFAAEGVGKIRLTGGEPLLRGGLERLVEMLARIDGVEDLALTTNGVLLGRHAHRLARAGLDRVTVSLDALEEDAYRAMSDTRLAPGAILAGIDQAQAAGLDPIKVNMVVRRGVNDHCVLAMAEHFRGRCQELRFIEYMDVGSTNGWREREVVSGAEILATIAQRWPLERLPSVVAGEVASRYRYLDGAGEIGVIASVSEPFCGGCTRARLTADGMLYTCLFASAGHDLKALLRGGAPEHELRRRLAEIWEARADSYSAERFSRLSSPAGKAERPRIEMSYVGG